MPQERLSYRDFEIEIAPGQGNSYPVAVLRSPSGQARNMMKLPLDQTPLGQLMRNLGKTGGEVPPWPAQICVYCTAPAEISYEIEFMTSHALNSSIDPHRRRVKRFL